MPGCAAVGCTNSLKKGFAMYRFPKDPKRRKEWLIKMKRDKWIPTDSSRICEVHFELESWEKRRADGKKKLMQNAVPTLFSFVKVRKVRKHPIERSSSLASTSVACETSSDSPEMNISELEITTMSSLSDISTVASTSQSTTDFSQASLQQFLNQTATQTSDEDVCTQPKSSNSISTSIVLESIDNIISWASNINDIEASDVATLRKIRSKVLNIKRQEKLTLSRPPRNYCLCSRDRRRK